MMTVVLDRALQPDEIKYLIQVFSIQRLTLESRLRDLEKSLRSVHSHEPDRPHVERHMSSLEMVRIPEVKNLLEALCEGWSGLCVECNRHWVTKQLLVGHSCSVFCNECAGLSRQTGDVRKLLDHGLAIG